MVIPSHSFCSRDKQQWSELLVWAEYAQNSCTHLSTNLIPFQCVPVFPWSVEPSDLPAVDDWFNHSQELWENTHVRLQRAKLYGSLPRTWHLSYLLKNSGLFNIVCQIIPVTYRINLPTHNCTVAPHPLIFSSSNQLMFPPTDNHSESELDTKQLQHLWYIPSWTPGGEGWVQYFIDWERYGPKERCWVNSDKVLDPSTTEKFYCNYPDYTALRLRGRPSRRGRPGGVFRRGDSVTNPLAIPPPHHQREASPEL